MNVKDISISSTFLCLCRPNLSFKLNFHISKVAKENSFVLETRQRRFEFWHIQSGSFCVTLRQSTFHSGLILLLVLEGALHMLYDAVQLGAKKIDSQS